MKKIFLLTIIALRVLGFMPSQPFAPYAKFMPFVWWGFAINLVSGAVAARTPRVQLTCVKLVATKEGNAGELTLSATDAEIAIKLTLAQVDVKEPGEALIPADKIRQIVSAEEAESTLTLETERETMHIKGGDAHFRVFGYPPGGGSAPEPGG